MFRREAHQRCPGACVPGGSAGYEPWSPIVHTAVGGGASFLDGVASFDQNNNQSGLKSSDVHLCRGAARAHDQAKEQGGDTYGSEVSPRKTGPGGFLFHWPAPLHLEREASKKDKERQRQEERIRERGNAVAAGLQLTNLIRTSWEELAVVAQPLGKRPPRRPGLPRSPGPNGGRS